MVLEEPAHARLSLLFDAPPDADVVRAALQLAPDIEASCIQLDDVNWVAQALEGLPAVEAGRFFVRGSHVPARRDGRIDLLIEAGEAFGSGHHGTTAGCLRAFDRALTRGARPLRVLDLGCGAGVLALAAARALPGAQIIATDIDPIAVRVTRENARLNRVHRRVAAYAGPGLAVAGLRGRELDLIFANILAAPLIALSGQIARAAAPDGLVILSGLLAPQARAVDAAFRTKGLVRETHTTRDGWSTLVLRRA